MREVAHALAFLHSSGVTHNDIKPENVMLHEVVVKLGDLGLTAKSSDRHADYTQFAMTVFCMVTGEKFGSRKFQPEIIPDILSACSRAVHECGATGRLLRALSDIPTILRLVFRMDIGMEAVSQWPTIQEWSFNDDAADGFDAQVSGASEPPCSGTTGFKLHREDGAELKICSMDQATHMRMVA